MTSADLNRILARWKPVRMAYEPVALAPRERELVERLVEASRCLGDIYWRQNDPEGLRLYQTATDPKLKRLLMINGSRFDLLNENRPFAGSAPAPPGRALYPAGVTREQIEAHVRAHPGEREATYSGYTVVKDGFRTVPYHVEYREFLEPAARLLREAAALSADAAFARFLRLRAGALLTDDYLASDLAWLDLKNPKFDVIFGPYETYIDELLGVKTAYGAAVLIRNEPESARLALFERYVPEMQDALPLPAAGRPSKLGLATPMEVMDSPFRSGDLRHGYQAVADNLPNDPRIHERKGSKKIFFKNFMDARVKYVILPVAQRLMRPDQAAQVSGEGYLIGTVLHEIAHGLGPVFARAGGKQVDMREAIGPVYSALEEAKADVVGMFTVPLLARRGALAKDRLPEYYASYAAGMLRSMRFGTGEAHGRAELMEFNYLRQQGAIAHAGGRYAVDATRMEAAIAALAKRLLEIEAAGDRAGAEAWFAQYGRMQPELQRALESASGVPVDLDPEFSFPDRVR
ncbi:MAG: Zn-dependent hydrolase [Bryobacteraceae bacterium]